MTSFLVLTWFCIIEEKGPVAEPVIFSVVVFWSVKGGSIVVKGGNVNCATKFCHA